MLAQKDRNRGKLSQLRASKNHYSLNSGPIVKNLDVIDRYDAKCKKNGE